MACGTRVGGIAKMPRLAFATGALVSHWYCTCMPLRIMCGVHTHVYAVPLLFACPCTCFVCSPGCSDEERREEGDVCERGEMLGGSTRRGELRREEEEISVDELSTVHMWRVLYM